MLDKEIINCYYLNIYLHLLRSSCVIPARKNCTAREMALSLHFISAGRTLAKNRHNFPL